MRSTHVDNYIGNISSSHAAGRAAATAAATAPTSVYHRLKNTGVFSYVNVPLNPIMPAFSQRMLVFFHWVRYNEGGG